MKDTVYCVLCTIVTLALGLIGARYVTSQWLLAFVESFQLYSSALCILLLLSALAFKRHWFAMLLFIPAVALCVHSVMMLREYSSPAAVAAEHPALRLLTFNIDSDNIANGGRIADFIIASKADIAIIEEAMPLIPDMARLDAEYPYRVGCGIGMPECDTLMLSKRPFRSPDIRSLSGLWDNRFIMIGIDMDGEPLNIAVAHLTKPYFDEFHAGELENLTAIMNETKGPLLLAGDFNAAVIEPDMRAFLGATGLRHLFPEPATWPVEAGAYGISIDHVFARPPVQLTSVRQIPDAMGSNHYGLMSEFTLRK